MKAMFLTLTAICALLCCVQHTAFSVTETTANQVEVTTVLKTQDFESGEKQMNTVASEPLERFLQDLNQRKDWDYACHNGQPGPDAAYLFKWVTRATSELERRGYYFDSAGQLHRPGLVVPLR